MMLFGMVVTYPGLGYNLSGAIKGFGSLRPVTGARDTRNSRELEGKCPLKSATLLRILSFHRQIKEILL